MTSAFHYLKDENRILHEELVKLRFELDHFYRQEKGFRFLSNEKRSIIA